MTVSSEKFNLVYFLSNRKGSHHIMYFKFSRTCLGVHMRLWKHIGIFFPAIKTIRIHTDITTYDNHDKITINKVTSWPIKGYIMWPDIYNQLYSECLWLDLQGRLVGILWDTTTVTNPQSSTYIHVVRWKSPQIIIMLLPKPGSLIPLYQNKNI